MAELGIDIDNEKAKQDEHVENSRKKQKKVIEPYAPATGPNSKFHQTGFSII